MVEQRTAPGRREARLLRVAGDVERVCILGAESTGKTTLARRLAERYETVWNPEYGRPYTLVGRPEGMGVRSHTSCRQVSSSTCSQNRPTRTTWAGAGLYCPTVRMRDAPGLAVSSSADACTGCS
jgi:hypothetical protein